MRTCFSTAPKIVHPVIADGVWDHRRVNVEEQQRDPKSLFSWTARMIRLRKECPEIGWGTWKLLATSSAHVLALRYDWRGNSIIVVHNFANRPQIARIRPGVDGGDRLVDLLEETHSRARPSGCFRSMRSTRWPRASSSYQAGLISASGSPAGGRSARYSPRAVMPRRVSARSRLGRPPCIARCGPWSSSTRSPRTGTRRRPAQPGTCTVSRRSGLSSAAPGARSTFLASRTSASHTR